ncbi:hypothetical protein SS37A_34740 [Methylocystis iwaonis]|uniref:Uncharacterized protein n=1 Tax=Methylocystis iwaonis TaxID=2885079 RepID=A0ABN6VN90_9HYPH|nr:hypothetical protein SS37A_34740 [Methylocystis iwaonis]
MVEWRQRADAHEFLRPYANLGDAGRIVEMGRGMFGHGPLFQVTPRRRLDNAAAPYIAAQRNWIGGAGTPPRLS